MKNLTVFTSSKKKDFNVAHPSSPYLQLECHRHKSLIFINLVCIAASYIVIYRRLVQMSANQGSLIKNTTVKCPTFFIEVKLEKYYFNVLDSISFKSFGVESACNLPSTKISKLANDERDQAYLDLALILRLFLFNLRMRFFFHFSLISSLQLWSFSAPRLDGKCQILNRLGCENSRLRL